ncbi:MAG: helix-turn-helix domain-containing protein [Candidatus Omnitrophota bacterium]
MMKGLGKRIQTLRKERRLTLIDVALKTGIDQATLSRIENGKMTGTLRSHMKIADVLQIPLPLLYENILAEVDKAQERAAREKVETFSHSAGAQEALLVSDILRKKMLPTLLKLKPNGKTPQEIHSPQSERFVFVLKGTVEAALAGETKVLKEGHSLYFNASKPHSFKNASRAEAVLLSVLSPTSL